MALCEIALMLGLTLSGACASPDAKPVLPAEDASAWSYKEPPPPPPPPPPPVPQPERIIERVEVIREVPAPTPEPETAPIPAVDPMMVMWAQYASAANAWRESNAASLASVAAAPRSVEGVAAMRANRPNTPAPPLPAVPAMVTPMDLQTPAAGVYRWSRKDGTGPVNNARILTADRYISAVLETGINSQLGDGEVIAVVTQHVYGAHSREILLPRGSRLICAYKSPADMGATRLALRCKRILLAESRAEIMIRAKVADQQGHSGITGEVDNRFVERYGTAFVLAGLSATVRLGAAATQSGSSPSGASYALQQGSQELGQQLGQITAAALEKSLDLKPIITIPQGYRVTIMPVDDWYLAPATAPDVPDETVTAAALAAPADPERNDPSQQEPTNEE